MATPMRKAFKAGNNELGIQTYVNYVNNSRFAWKRLPVTEQHEALRNSYEWEVMMTAGVLFPSIDIKELAKLKAPVLLVSGGRSYRFDMLTDGLLQHTIPNNSRVIFAGANDRPVSYTHLNDCPVPVENLLSEHGNGFKIAVNILNLGRIKLGGAALGGAKAVITNAIRLSLIHI